MDISVGKFTLESLTTGMYNEPETCFREYIQNAVDSIDNAVNAGLVSIEDARIEIIVDEPRHEISIRDNGTGISVSQAPKTLLDIGNSSKTHTSNRGFRGIGRLGGLSYCKRLSFCTTYPGEPEKTIISFDCDRLKELLIPGQGDEHTLQGVIEAVTTVEILEEQESAHYFLVKMERVDDIATLLDIDLVKDYVSQIAPVPFKKTFYWGDQVKLEMQQKGYSIAEYPIFIGKSFEHLSQVYKPYKGTLDISTRGGSCKDQVLNLSFFDIVGMDNIPLAHGWYAESEFSGTLIDDRMSGIRVRVGNILIGSGKSMAQYFKESRFNGWTVGEIYVVSGEMIPNARRDDFERNDAFQLFERGVRTTVGTEVSEKIRAASKARNNPSQKAIKKAEKEVARVEQVLTTGFNSTYEKEQIASSLAAVQKELRIIPKAAAPEVVAQKVQLISKLKELSTSVSESTNYRAKKDIQSEFSKAEKKIVQAMLEVLTRNFERDTVDSLYKEFLAELKPKGK